jgi:hypothetical protein
MIVGKKQLTHLSTCWRVLINADGESGSTNMITGNCTNAITEPLSAISILFFGIVTALL